MEDTNGDEADGYDEGLVHFIRDVVLSKLMIFASDLSCTWANSYLESIFILVPINRSTSKRAVILSTTWVSKQRGGKPRN